MQACDEGVLEPNTVSRPLDDRVLRLDVMTPPGEFSLDDASADKIDRLMALGHGVAVEKANLQAVKQRFFSAPAPAFAPVQAVKP